MEEMSEHMTSSENERKRAVDMLEHGKWPFGVILIGNAPLITTASKQMSFAVEVLAYVFAVSLHCCFEPEFDFEPFQETARGQQRLDLSKVKDSIGRSTFDIDSSASSKRLRQKMARKYGHLSHTTNWGNDKRWWPFTSN